jgi:proline iminopeptidase
MRVLIVEDEPLVGTFAFMYPELQSIDFGRDVPRLEVPYYMLDGHAELTSRRELALEFDRLDTPRKRIFSFECSVETKGGVARRLR